MVVGVSEPWVLEASSSEPCVLEASSSEPCVLEVSNNEPCVEVVADDGVEPCDFFKIWRQTLWLGR